MKYAYILVEGPHDVEFVGRFLKQAQCSRVQFKSRLDNFWHTILPTTFPFESAIPNESEDSGDLLKRAPIPVFFQNQNHSIAVHSANGIEKIVQTLEESLFNINLSELSAIGIILDADKHETPDQHYMALKQSLHRSVPSLNLSSALRDENNRFFSVEIGPSQRTGVFILPDNQSQGTLEDLLLKCGEQIYPDLYTKAVSFVDSVDSTQLTSEEQRELRKPAGKDKAKVGTIASILKPGKAIQVSIQDNRWLSTTSFQIPELNQFQNFLSQLLDLAIPTGTV